ncbi:MAG: magnesium transporter [Anaerolineae bacterium]|uniref:magnesium transporter n=1 Tax=Promineifilum sp. TaxID=2664178 RepID=UPI001D37DF53|nr:magnesium transporter [Anaerolineales bacterium]MCO5180481.1 magnesium transporter [Promineifilum sp.]MCW5848285.1 magnesium transporter [Anaerolineae bacterium]
MLYTDLDDILGKVRASLEIDDLAGAVATIEALRAPDQADLFHELDDQYQAALLPRLDPEDSADILEELEDEDAARLVAGLTREEAVRIIDEMEPDEAADLLGELSLADQEYVLTQLADQAEVRPLLLHPEDTAGGLMTSEFLALGRRMTAGEALAALRTWRPDAEETYDVYVVDRFGRLAGEVTMRRLLQADPATVLIDVVDPESVSVLVGTDQEEVARIMSRYDLVSLPVVDAQGLLVGVITIDDVLDVLEEETTEDFQRLGASEPLDRPYLDTSVFTIFRKRIGWLLLLFITGTLTGSVLHLFEEQLDAVVALALFIPLLIGTGGNAGAQTTSTIIRALAVDDIDRDELLRPFVHELIVGVLLGLVMAVIAYIRAYTWDTGHAVALTVSVAIFAIVVWANGLGSVLPILVQKLGLDPTVVSGPAMSTLVDTTGLLIYFTIAGLLLSL